MLKSSVCRFLQYFHYLLVSTVSDVVCWVVIVVSDGCSVVSVVPVVSVVVVAVLVVEAGAGT